MHCRVDKVRNKKEISRRSISSDVARSFLVYCQIKCIYISGDGRTNSNTKRLITWKYFRTAPYLIMHVHLTGDTLNNTAPYMDV